MSLFLRPASWGRGLAGDLLTLLPAMAAAFHVRILLAYVVASHTASRRVLERVGFTVDDVLSFDGAPDLLYRYRLEL